MRWMRVLVSFLLLVIIVGMIYIGDEIWVSNTVRQAVLYAFQNNGASLDSDQGYGSRLNFAAGSYDNGGKPVVQRYSLSMPISIHCFTNAVATYQYTYMSFDKANYDPSDDSKSLREIANSPSLVSGSWDIPVTVWLQFRHWHWIVTDVYEAP